jgi:hypothetical protein
VVRGVAWGPWREGGYERVAHVMNWVGDDERRSEAGVL